jgi:hypothetical protein
MNTTTLTIIDQAPLLSSRMTGLAQMYVDARRQQGEQLLVMARAVALAREEAQHGEWGIWCDAVQLQERFARRLIAIHNRASISPKFAEAVKQNWFNATVAALVAERDDDEVLLGRLLGLPEPPTRQEVQALANPAPVPDLKAVSEPSSIPRSEAPIIRALVARAEQAGLNARATHDEAIGAGVLIWADDEDPDKLLPLLPDDAVAWLDRFEEEAATQDMRMAPQADLVNDPPAPTAEPAVVAKEPMSQPQNTAPRQDTFRIPMPAEARYQQLAFTLFADQIDVVHSAMTNEATASGLEGIAAIVEIYAAPLPPAERAVLEPVRAALRTALAQLATMEGKAAA